MKVRNGFVSNSSSASFVIKVEHLTNEQIDLLLDFDRDGWDINVVGDTMYGDCVCDNGELKGYMFDIGVRREVIEWEDNS